MTSRGSAYITGTSSFLPNAPVANDVIENVLGMIVRGPRLRLPQGDRRRPAQGAVAPPPQVRDTGFEHKLGVIRQVQSEAVAALGDAATYLETTPFLTDASGVLLATATVGKRKDQDLREDDGIHFTMAGSQFFADKVYPQVLRALGVEDAAPAVVETKKKKK